MIDDRETCDVCGVDFFEDRSHLHPPPQKKLSQKTEENIVTHSEELTALKDAGKATS